MRTTLLHALDRVKHVHLAVRAHLLAQHGACAVQPALTGSVHTVHEHGGCREGALSLRLVDGVYELKEAFSQPRDLVVHRPRLQTELRHNPCPGRRIQRARQLGRSDGHVIALHVPDRLHEERLAVASHRTGRPVLGARIFVEVDPVQRHDRRDVVVVDQLPQIRGRSCQRRVRDDEAVSARVRVDVHRVDVVRASQPARSLQNRAMTVVRDDRREAVLLPIDVRQRSDRLCLIQGRNILLENLRKKIKLKTLFFPPTDFYQVASRKLFVLFDYT